MKLLSRYTRASIVTQLIILLVSSVCYYFILRYVLLQQLDKDLKVEEHEIIDYVGEKNSLPNASNYKGQQIIFEKAGSEPVHRQVFSTDIYNKAEDEHEPVRKLTFPIMVNGQLYKAIVIKSQVEAEDLLQLIVLITGGIFLLLLILTSFINRFVLGKLWQPFYFTLSRLKEFNLNNAAIQLPETNLDEFNQLNVSVKDMTTRVSKEYETLKTFTDNASHEMQTPLAIINSKLDLLIQSSHENQADQLQAIYDATSRLTKLNQTLLLLARIENQQFRQSEQIDFKALLQAKLQQFEELIQSKKITVEQDIEPAFVSINKELADILLNNLLSNAIRHNYDSGVISFKLTQQEFTIANTGSVLTFDEAGLFGRFKKGSNSEGAGLGLAVVKQICDTTGFAVTYFFRDDRHMFVIAF